MVTSTTTQPSRAGTLVLSVTAVITRFGPLAVGGVMNHKRQPPLRIDVTQHQMHAVIQALNHVYGE